MYLKKEEISKKKKQLVIDIMKLYKKYTIY